MWYVFYLQLQIDTIAAIFILCTLLLPPAIAYDDFLSGLYNLYNSCNRVDIKSTCVYTVVCTRLAGYVFNAACDTDKIYVTFVISSSELKTVNSHFFAPTKGYGIKVKKFMAINNVWRTIEEATFSYYPHTMILLLPNNAIRYMKGMTLRGLNNVEILDLSKNQIEVLDRHSLKTSETGESKLISLDLSYNKLTVLPSELFSAMSNLQVLNLRSNSIQKLPNDIFMNLKNLTELRLDNNCITSLNMSLINLVSLQKLDLSRNFIKTISPLELNRLSYLISINISKNSLIDVKQNFFSNALNLEVVDLSDNAIVSEVQNIMFVNNKQLKYLDLQNNKIYKIENGSFKHLILDFINIRNNNLSGDINYETFSGFNKTTVLDLSNQSIENLRNYSFSQMPLLFFLNLTKNYVNEIETHAFADLNLLNVLDLSHNNISCIDFLSISLSKLTELYLNHNNISILKSKMFQLQTQLKFLTITYNRIVIIEQFSLPLRKLQFIDVRGNTLSGNIENEIFCPAAHVTHIDLSNLNITYVENMTFVDLPNMIKLNISNNQINAIGIKNFINVNKMQSLDLSYNNLSDISLYYISTGLKVVLLNNNKLGKIPYANTLNEIEVLTLDYNKIVQINLTNFEKLVSLSIRNNLLNVINRKSLKSLNYLFYFDISYNKIEEILPGTLESASNLKFLNMSSNYISKISKGSFKGLHSIQTLDLSNNRISSIDIDVFHNCKELRKLIIDNNLIKQFNIDKVVHILPKLSSLSLGGNEIPCKDIAKSIEYIDPRNNHYVEVTSIENIYNKSNVHGIRCTWNTSNDSYLPTEKSPDILLPGDDTMSVWFPALKILAVVIGLGLFIFISISPNGFCLTNKKNKTVSNMVCSSIHNTNLLK